MAHLDLFLFVDALGWEVVRRHPALEFLGVRAPCRTVFGYSSTCDPTILTGALPREHGHFSFFARCEPAESPFRGLSRWLGWVPDRLGADRRIRNRLNPLVRRRLGYTGYFHLYSVPFRCLRHLDYTEKRDLYRPGGIIGGQRTVFDDWNDSGKAWHCSDWRRSDEENHRALLREIDRGDILLAYVFTGGLDGLMHRLGTRAPEVGEWMEGFAGRVREMLDRASGRYAGCGVHVFSDHGMSDTRRLSRLMREWQRRSGMRYGRDYVAVWDSTMARFWFHHAAARRDATAFLTEAKDGRIVPPGQLAEWGCDFPGDRYGELFYLLPSGSIFAPSFMNRGRVAGMHGYDPGHEDSTACWMADSDRLGIPEGLPDISGILRQAALA